ncbi:MAG: ribosome small subunit-dependent GTPase [Candidatus Saccharibacteria bacterium]|nr:ribosome small subunit-dependent GTPase [Candidatus Saccharibacteria bacterium]
MNTLETFGWNERLAHDWQEIVAEFPYLTPARVTADFGTSLRIASPDTITAELSGKLAHYSDRQDIPKVGDWVGVHITDNNAVIERVLPRTGEIARAAAGNKTVKQVIAGGIDIAFVILALDNDFNVDRLRRYLYQLSINNITPIIVLNKADKTEDPGSFVTQLDSFKIPIIITTAKEEKGINEIIGHIPAGKTAILLGSSGVGKSTITNKLLGDIRQKTQEVRASDDTGKHTTVHRELFMLPNGGMLIDTPGIRELQLWGTEEDLEENFDDVTALISQCKYASCQHNGEEGCAVQAAIKDGSLDPKHYAAYVKLKSELGDLKTRKVAKSKADSAKAKKRNIAKQGRKLFKEALDEE